MQSATTSIVLMVLLAVQVGVQPLFTREYIDASVFPTAIILACEIAKFLIAGSFLLATGTWSAAVSDWTIASSVKIAGLPAVVYAVQNSCIQIAYRHVDGLTFNLLNQTKTIFTALCLLFVMGRRQSPMQCVALAGLLLASVLLGLESEAPPSSASTSAEHYQKGVILVLAASVLSGLAAALSQKGLQSNKRDSYLFTMELAVFSGGVLLVSLLFSADGQAMATSGFFRGWTWFTIFPIIFQGLGGIIVGLVMKYAGGVQKGFSIMGGILLSGFFQLFLYGQPLSPASWIALPLVLGSSWMYIVLPSAGGAVSAKKNK